MAEYSATLDSTNNLVTLQKTKSFLGIDPGNAQVVQVDCTNENAGGGIGGEYWLISSQVNDYYVWYDVDNGSTDPAVANRVGIEVDISDGDGADTVADKTATAVTAVSGMTAVASGNVVTVTNDEEGNVTAPTAGTTPFTVTEAVVGSPGDISENNILIDHINMASLWFNSECDRQLKSRSQTEYHDYPGDPYLLYLNHPPISSVSLYTNADTPRSFTSDDLVSANDYEVYTEDNVGKIYLTGNSFITGRRTIKVTYTGGFSTIPEDLQMGCLHVVAWAYNYNRNNLFAVAGHNRPEGTGVTGDKDLPPLAKQMIQKYRRWGAIV